MGCQPSIDRIETKQDSEMSNEELQVGYRSIIGKDRGDIFEFYHFSSIISRSPTSIVRKVIHRSSKIERVCKIIPLNKRQGITVMKQVQTLRKLDHPNIIKICEYFLQQSFLYIVMEQIPGQTVVNHIVKYTSMQVNDIASIRKQLLSAIQFIHSSGFVHRNINHHNILLVKDKSIILKLIDFSQSSVKYCSTPLPINKHQKNTAYLKSEKSVVSLTIKQQNSPEVLESKDIWACAMIFYFLLSGSSPENFHMKREQCIQKLKDKYKNKEGIQLLEKMTANNIKNKLEIKEILEHPFFNLTKENQKNKQVIMFDNLLNYKMQGNLKSLMWMYASLNISNFKEKSQYMIEFVNLDKNRDGHLDFNQLVQGIKNSFNITEQQAQKHVKSIFASLDKNNNGYLDYTEFVMGTTRISQVVTQQSIQKMFYQMDSNNDGSITIQQLGNIIEGVNRKNILDGKKKITYKQFKSIMFEIAIEQQTQRNK